MYIPLSDDKHPKVRDSSKKHTGNPRQIQSETKCSLRQNSVQEFFSDGQKKNFSQTEFCLGLHTAVVFRMQSFNLVLCNFLQILFRVETGLVQF